MRKLLLALLGLTAIGGSVGFAATLSVGSGHLWSGSQTLTKGTCTLTGTSVTSDTDVNQLSGNGTNGGSTTMMVLPFSGFAREAFVSFDLSSCNIPSTGGADSATLSLHITNAPSSSRTIDVTPVLSSWSESLTWNLLSGLTFGTRTAQFSTGTTSDVTKTVTVTGDVDQQIKTGSVYGWRLSDSGSNSFNATTFATSESTTASSRPVLTINYEK